MTDGMYVRQKNEMLPYIDIRTCANKRVGHQRRPTQNGLEAKNSTVSQQYKEIG